MAVARDDALAQLERAVAVHAEAVEGLLTAQGAVKIALSAALERSSATQDRAAAAAAQLAHAQAAAAESEAKARGTAEAKAREAAEAAENHKSLCALTQSMVAAARKVAADAADAAEAADADAVALQAAAARAELRIAECGKRKRGEEASGAASGAASDEASAPLPVFDLARALRVAVARSDPSVALEGGALCVAHATRHAVPRRLLELAVANPAHFNGDVFDPDGRLKVVDEQCFLRLLAVAEGGKDARVALEAGCLALSVGSRYAVTPAEVASAAAAVS